MDCIFCKIEKGDIPSYKLYEDDKFFIILDINPEHTGHCLLIPKNHYKDLYDINDDVFSSIKTPLNYICSKLTDKLKCDGIRIVQNNGICQEVKHFHIHIIPRYNKETKLSLEEVYNILKK